MSKDQHVYFIADKRRRYVKIGVSNNPWWRIQDLQAGSPIELRLDLVLNFSDDRNAAMVYEDALHQHFAAHWRFREWFNYAKPIREFVASWQDSVVGMTVPRPPCTAKQYTDENGACLTKADFMAFLKSRLAA